MFDSEILNIIAYFYPEDTPFRRMLLQHSRQVRNKALELLGDNKFKLDPSLVANGAMLHDIGIGRCKAEEILCCGGAPYIAHGIIGGEMLREYGKTHNLDMEFYARICERHTGSGLTRGDIIRQQLPLPESDYLPESPEEKLICLADKFYSKSGEMQEKELPAIRKSMLKFGVDS
ncbi:MAG: HD domain-containing protein, partial [Victivallaceae bacterium]